MKWRLWGRKLLVLLTVLVCLTLGFRTDAVSQESTAVESTEPLAGSGEWLSVGSSDRLALFLEKNGLFLKVHDKLADKWWSSTPDNYMDDEQAEGATSTNMASMLLVKYVDNSGVVGTVNSYTGSISRQAILVKALANGTGFVVEYNFPRKKENFKIPVRITVDKDTLRAEIQFDQIVENGTARVVEVSLFPYFGAGSQKDR